jgi:hypothetical protein
MLTALSVARDCGLVASNERVAAVHVTPAQEGTAAKVYYSDCESCETFDNKVIKFIILNDNYCDYVNLNK